MNKYFLGFLLVLFSLSFYSCRETADVDTLQDEEQQTEETTDIVNLGDYE